MKVLVMNCGSSSVKYQVIDMPGEDVLAKGLVENIGGTVARLKHEPAGKEKYIFEGKIDTAEQAVQLVLEALIDSEHGVLTDISEISAVGHRVVHGGESYAESVVIDDEVIKLLEEYSELAPLHNPPNITGIRACQAVLPGVPMVAVFDTAFHQTMPAESFMYPLPYEYYEKYKVRRYGFHGTSHKYVSDAAADMLGKPQEELKIITCHLGNGASLAAVKGGKCLDTSMGFTPLDGLMMGTRTGEVDASIITFLMEKEGITAQECLNIFNKKSGILGISGVASDLREVNDAAEAGNYRAQLSLDMFAKRVKSFIGSYFAELNGVDAIVFTAGIGENDKTMRERICKNMDSLGIKLDLEKNDVRGEQRVISTDDSPVKILLIPTNEELMIAKDTYNLV